MSWQQNFLFIFRLASFVFSSNLLSDCAASSSGCAAIIFYAIISKLCAPTSSHCATIFFFYILRQILAQSTVLQTRNFLDLHQYFSGRLSICFAEQPFFRTFRDHILNILSSRWLRLVLLTFLFQPL